MKESLLFLFMGIGLSMDAFSLAIIYGTNNLAKKKCIILSLIVGIFHFIMPNIGGLLSKQFLSNFIYYGNIITGIVFLILTIQMITSLKEEKEKEELTGYIEMFFFALAVSLDSFTVGMALSLEKQNLILGGIIFTTVSFIFTLSGLLLGKYLNKKTGMIGKIIGIFILLSIALNYLFDFH